MEILKGFFDNLQSKQEYLNYTRIKSIQVCLDPEKLPNMVPVFKLNSIDHRCHVTFSKETMNEITRKSDEIQRCLRQEEEKLFILNDELKVFSEKMHNKCAVCFLNFQGVRVNLMIDTFRQMIEKSRSTLSMYKEIEQKMHEAAKNLKQLFDGLLAKYNQCNVNNPEFQGFLQQLQQHVSSFSQGDSTVSDEYNMADSNDDENEVENDSYDEYYNRRRRGYRWNHYGEYDEDMDDDDVDDEDLEDEDVDDY